MVTDRERLLLGSIDKFKMALSELITQIGNGKPDVDKAIALMAEGKALEKAYLTLHQGDRGFTPELKEEKILTISADSFGKGK